MLKKIAPWLAGGTLLFVVSWYLAIKYAMIVIAGAIGFGAGILYQNFRNKKGNLKNAN